MPQVSLLLNLFLCHFYVLSVADSPVPLAMFKDDILFDIHWPGGYSKDLESSKQQASGPAGEVQAAKEGVSEDSLLKLSNSLLTEADHSEQEYVEIKSSHNEDYLCEMPHWTSLTSKEESEGTDDDMNSPQELIKSLKSRCTRLAMGYWVYELCHGIHVRQFHETKEPKKEPKKPGDALDEYLLGVPKSTKLRGQTSDGDVKSSPLQSQSTKKEEERSSEKIPVWLYNGNEYPYYEIQYGDGTPCDLKEGTPRSTNIKYICDVNSHSTGTFLHIEEVSTCKYDAVVAVANLCQNKQYRLKEDPVYPVKCFPKRGSPTKPKSLLEHEVAMAQYSKVRQSKKLKAKGSTRGEEKDSEGDDEKDYNMKDRSRNLPTSRTHSDYLDEGFIKSFLAGDLCLRGGSGWWQHEVCYGKHVKQVHEEVGKPPVEVFLGYWVDDGHKRWFTSSSTTKRQSKNFVIHLYMKGDICDITGVARQCQVKFRCSTSSRLSEVSIYLEEPTTCNYILTVEAAFLCPLLKTTDSLGMFSFPSKGIESLEKSSQTKDKWSKGTEVTMTTEDSKKSEGRSDSKPVSGEVDDKKWKEEDTLMGEEPKLEKSEEGGESEGFGAYDGGEELDEEGNLKPEGEGREKEEKYSSKSERDSNEKKRT